jgi:putative drug exporter of the RND superfamily
MSTEDAVAHGIKTTAGVVTSAAIVMVAVFGIFATLDEIVFQMMGVGLAAAILIDATIVRAILLPSTMKLLGDWNWYLPRWLGWLPSIATDRATPPTPRTTFDAGTPHTAGGRRRPVHPARGRSLIRRR